MNQHSAIAGFKVGWDQLASSAAGPTLRPAQFQKDIASANQHGLQDGLAQVESRQLIWLGNKGQPK